MRLGIGAGEVHTRVDKTKQIRVPTFARGKRALIYYCRAADEVAQSVPLEEQVLRALRLLPVSGQGECGGSHVSGAADEGTKTGGSTRQRAIRRAARGIGNKACSPDWPTYPVFLGWPRPGAHTAYDSRMGKQQSYPWSWGGAEASESLPHDGWRYGATRLVPGRRDATLATWMGETAILAYARGLRDASISFIWLGLCPFAEFRFFAIVPGFVKGSKYFSGMRMGMCVHRHLQRQMAPRPQDQD